MVSDSTQSRAVNNNIDHIRATVRWLIIDSAAMVIRSPIAVNRGTAGRKVGVSGTNRHDSGSDNSAGDKGATTTTTPVDVDINTPVRAATATMDATPPTSSGLGLADCDKIERVRINPFNMKAKTNCKKA
jgi:hypothetical protein